MRSGLELDSSGSGVGQELVAEVAHGAESGADCHEEGIGLCGRGEETTEFAKVAGHCLRKGCKSGGVDSRKRMLGLCAHLFFQKK